MTLHAIGFVLSQSNPPSGRGDSGPSGIVVLIELALVILAIAGMWKTFEKAGQPGWGAIIPFFNIYLLCKIAGRPGWWLILFLIPFVNFIMLIIVSIDIAKNFGQGVGFGIGLALLGFVFYPLLGFGDATYQPITGPAVQRGFPVTPT